MRAVVQPLRRKISSFVHRGILGSGICGSAKSPALLIVGRAVQGIGPSGKFRLCSLIFAFESYRYWLGNFVAIILVLLLVGGLAFILLFLFLRVKWDRSTTAYEKLRRLDYIDKGTLTASTMLDSNRSDLGRFVGAGGLGLFVVYEGLTFVTEPVVLASNIKQSYGGHQLIGRSSSFRSISNLLSVRDHPAAESALLALGIDFFSVMNMKTSTAAWVWIDIVAMEPSETSIKEVDQAVATASWTFIRSFEEPVRRQIWTVFTKTIQKLFLVAVPFVGFTFLLILFQKEIKLRTELKTGFGLEERKTNYRTSRDM
ncbi:MFS general substrate transporter [Hypoxylon sp. FL1150]|nr:MFS general substrate transporter [Hypoxylon sp. FL1150]